MLYEAREPEKALSVTCPACVSSRQHVERLSIALNLMILQSTVEETAARAPASIASELARVLAELKRLGSALSPVGDD